MLKYLMTAVILAAMTVVYAETKHITELNNDNFQKEVIESDQIVLVDFWAPWCGPCQTLGPIIEELAGENSTKMKFTKLNVDNAQKIAGDYGIRSIPTVGIFKDGKPIDGFVGLRSKAQIEEILKKHYTEVKKEVPKKEEPKKEVKTDGKI